MGATLSLSQARRIALKAQGLATVRPAQPVTAREVGRTFAQLQLVQIDSVNVLSRSHYLPFFSRLGPYDTTLLNILAGRSPRKLMEYWAHEASFIRPEHFHDLRPWQSRSWVGSDGMESGLRETLETSILQLLTHSNPLTAREIKARIGHEETVSKDHWGWNWSAVKRALEGLFARGVVGVASRNEQFERRYSLIEKILPPARRGLWSPGEAVDPGTKEESLTRLISAAARAHGIGTTRCFADYFRLPVKAAEHAVKKLVAAGELASVAVDGWSEPTFLHATAGTPRKATGQALLSPFDSLVFERRRLERLFNFHYRLEIYTPEPKRKYGYYVLPFLLGENIVARVDLKADRQAGVLKVRGAFAEPGAPTDTANRLSAELELMAQWLGLGAVVVLDHGDLAATLKAALQ
ncbi:winged helix-turn-helix domain-containing protein [Arthrobacter sp. HLT1-20]